jgi:hypothetical protein
MFVFGFVNVLSVRNLSRQTEFTLVTVKNRQKSKFQRIAGRGDPGHKRNVGIVRVVLTKCFYNRVRRMPNESSSLFFWAGDIARFIHVSQLYYQHCELIEMFSHVRQ